MPLIKSLEQQRFSERGPVPRPLNVGDGLAVMLLCLQGDQSIVAPAGDGAETVFTVLGGSGAIREGEEEHEVAVGDAVHVPPGVDKALLARGEPFTVLGVRRMASRKSTRVREERADAA